MVAGIMIARFSVAPSALLGSLDGRAGRMYHGSARLLLSSPHIGATWQITVLARSADRRRDLHEQPRITRTSASMSATPTARRSVRLGPSSIRARPPPRRRPARSVRGCSIPTSATTSCGPGCQSDLANWTRGDRKARFEQTAERPAAAVGAASLPRTPRGRAPRCPARCSRSSAMTA